MSSVCRSGTVARRALTIEMVKEGGGRAPLSWDCSLHVFGVLDYERVRTITKRWRP